MENNKPQPYVAPKTQQSYSSNDFEPNTQTWYHLSGRIGRLRYVTYGIFLMLMLCVATGLIGAVFGGIAGAMENPNAGLPIIPMILFVILFIAYCVFGIAYAVRRLHDLGKSGWFFLLNFIPIVNFLLALYLLFAKGNEGANEYGNPPRENKWYHWTALILPIPLIGILAAIAIPAYEDYTKRAMEAQAQIEQMQQVGENEELGELSAEELEQLQQIENMSEEEVKEITGSYEDQVAAAIQEGASESAQNQANTDDAIPAELLQDDTEVTEVNVPVQTPVNEALPAASIEGDISADGFATTQESEMPIQTDLNNDTADSNEIIENTDSGVSEGEVVSLEELGIE